MALDDKAVRRIVYSNKHCPLSGDDQSLERWFERRTRSASADVREKLKKTFKSQDEVLKASARREEIAYDISEHFNQTTESKLTRSGSKECSPPRRNTRLSNIGSR